MKPDQYGTRVDTDQTGDPKQVPVDMTAAEAPLDYSRLLAMLHTSMEMQISLADGKSSIIVAANSILIASLALSASAFSTTLFDPAAPMTQRLALVTTAAMGVFLVLSIVYALRSSKPNLRRTRLAHNLFFFGDIAGMDEDVYVQSFLDMDMQAVKQQVARQIHARSLILMTKYLSIRWSLRFLFTALGLFVVTRTLLAL
jgi:hypothetical protein